MAQTADIPLDVMARVLHLLDDEGRVSLLKVERAIGERCGCRDPSENAGCLPHRVYAMLIDGFDNWIELYSENEISARIDDGALLDKDQVQEKVDAEVAKVQEKVDEVKEELGQAKTEIDDREAEIKVLRAATHTLTVAVGEEKAAALLKDDAHVQPFAEREASARAKFEADTRAKIREHFTAELELAQTKAREAEEKLSRSKNYAKYQKRVAENPPRPLTRDEVDAEFAAERVELDDQGRFRGAKLCWRDSGPWILDYGKHDMLLTDRNVFEFKYLLASARASQLATKIGATVAAAPAAAPATPTSGIVVEGKDAYEVARHLAMQPSGLQAMLEIARAQRPAEFKRKGK